MSVFKDYNKKDNKPLIKFHIILETESSDKQIKKTKHRHMPLKVSW